MGLSPENLKLRLQGDNEDKTDKAGFIENYPQFIDKIRLPWLVIPINGSS
ncbi:hypothetical protein [Moorena sp. SIO2C4]|uniref:Uncharacterized protein n=1 Tax=Moorena producens 3L TaxID=489825 RepID=F4XPG5_9CYAN|nr:hypothetical protein [Moorena sp. SIO2C4]EGJ33419.1 hypothetical protein LYNGBM3L_34840 [Moorena producens 3L]